MSNKNILVSIALVTFSTPLACFAATPGNAYFGAQYSQITYKEDGVEDLNPSALIGRLGLNMSEYLSLEGRIGFGLSNDTAMVLGVPVDFESDSLFGAYLLGRLPVSDSFSIYGVIGFTSIEVTASVSGFSVSDDGSDTSFGAGMEFGFSDDVSMSLEYMSYYDKEGVSIDAVGLGVNVEF